LLALFDSKKVGPSEAELKLKSKAFYEKVSGDLSKMDINLYKKEEEELDVLNKELLLKTFLEGKNEPGARDNEVYEELKDVEIDKERHPNLYRWKNFIESSR